MLEDDFEEELYRENLYYEYKDRYEESKKEIEKLQNIIKEAREYIIWQKENPTYDNIWRKWEVDKLLEILDKGDDDLSIK